MRVVLIRSKRQDPVQGLKNLYNNFTSKLSSNLSDFYASRKINVNSLVRLASIKLKKQQRLLNKKKWFRELKNGTYFSRRYAILKRWYSRKLPIFYAQMEIFFKAVENSINSTLSNSRVWLIKNSPRYKRVVIARYQDVSRFTNKVVPKTIHFFDVNFTKIKSSFS